jgi:hypothetical protein
MGKSTCATPHCSDSNSFAGVALVRGLMDAGDIITKFMAKFISKSSRRPDLSPVDPLLAAKTRKTFPHEFVLDAIAPLLPFTRPMFGCTAVYVQEKIVLILREKEKYPADNGVWLATTAEHHESLRAEFPNMRSIGLLGKKITGWQILASDAPDFEEAALRACELVMMHDPRIGKVPGVRKARKPKSREKKNLQTQKAGKALRRKP